MQERYDPAAVEVAAQRSWDEQRSFEAREDPNREKYYCLSMFPYPSGRLHMGHVRNYTIGDVLARFMRMQGRNVLQPMGWDAFGLPAENAAMANAVPPANGPTTTSRTCRRSSNRSGFALDWSRELDHLPPRILPLEPVAVPAHAREGHRLPEDRQVNWDPVDKTVLANEQVIDGRGWRTGAPVEKREIPMYYLKITDYAEDLLDALDGMPGWPERVRTMQANWIGKSEGVRFGFPYDIGAPRERGRAAGVHHARRHPHGRDVLRGCAGTSAGRCTRLAAIAQLAAFIEECRRTPAVEAALATQEKKGMATGCTVRHPLTGATVPLWVGNYVLMSYGEGAVMGVPAHDERDFEFAKKYSLPIKPVIDFAGPHLQHRGLGAVVRRAWALRQFGRIRRPGISGGGGCHCRRSRASWSRRETDDLAPARLGHLAPALLGLPHPHHPMRGMRRGAGAGCRSAGGAAGESGAGRQRQSAAQGCGLSRPAAARDAAHRRGVRPTPWTHSSTPPGTSCASPAATMRVPWSMSA